MSVRAFGATPATGARPAGGGGDISTTSTDGAG
jgi:hypothetical protein